MRHVRSSCEHMYLYMYIYIYLSTCVYIHIYHNAHTNMWCVMCGQALTSSHVNKDRTIFRVIVSFIGLFCKRDLKVCVCVLYCVCMGWLRLVGSLKLQVSFAKEPIERVDILQKRPIFVRSLLIVAVPCILMRDTRSFLTRVAAVHSFLKYRVAKTHRIPYLYRSFSAKMTYI